MGVFLLLQVEAEFAKFAGLAKNDKLSTLEFRRVWRPFGDRPD